MDNHRSYKRGSHFNSTASVSREGKAWEKVSVADVSSGGLKFRSATEYAEGDILMFDLLLNGFFTEIEVKTKGEVCRKTPVADGYQYGIAFKDLSPEKKIQIDENIRNDRPVAGGGYEMD